MALTENDVRGIADYACIALSDSELAEMTAYLNDAVTMLEPVLAYADADVEPTFHPVGGLANVMAPDAPDAGRALSIDEALHGAASTRDRSFRVPSILGTGGDR